MKKEKLTLTNVTKDLRDIAFFNISNVRPWRFSFIAPITMLAVMLGILLSSVWVGILIFLPAVYHIIRYVQEYRKHLIQKKALSDVLDRGEVSVSVKQLSHIAEETIYEPHSSGRYAHATKEVTFFYFEAGGHWRMPYTLHYSWSKDYHLSPKGLENISLKGDEFFYVSLQGHYDIAYIYPCKFFELDSSLKNNNRTV